jgi:hypothetical protein
MYVRGPPAYAIGSLFNVEQKLGCPETACVYYGIVNRQVTALQIQP